MKALIFGLVLSIVSSVAHSHGNHGGVGGQTAQLSIIELPVHISLSGEVELHLPFGIGQRSEYGEDAHQESIINLAPIFGVAMKSVNRLINLEVAQTKAIGELEVASEEAPFMLIRQKDLGYGAGVEAHVGPHEGNQIFPGIFPSKSKKVVGIHRLESLSHRKNAPSIKIPWHKHDIKNWVTGDSVNYLSTGSINFSVGAGLENLASLGTEVMVQGTWDVNILKLDENVVEVSIAHNKLKNLGLFLSGVWVINASQNWMKSFNRAFVYKFDLNQPEGLRAYREFIKGRFLFAQSAANYSTSVTEVSRSSGSSSGRSRNLTLGISMILGWNHSVGKMFEVNDSTHEGHQDRVHAHIFSKEQSATGVMIKDYARSEMIASMVYSHQNDEMLQYDLQYKWKYEKNQMNLSTFSQKLSKQFEMVGLYQVNYDFPVSKMGFMRGEFDLHLSQDHFFIMSEIPDLWEKWESKRLVMTTKRCEGRDNKCYLKNSRRVKNNITYLKSYFQIIQDAEQRKDARTLSLHLNLFFQALLKSPANFQLLSDFTTGLAAKVQIKGEKIKQYYWSQPVTAYAP